MNLTLVADISYKILAKQNFNNTGKFFDFDNVMINELKGGLFQNLLKFCKNDVKCKFKNITIMQKCHCNLFELKEKHVEHEEDLEKHPLWPFYCFKENGDRTHWITYDYYHCVDTENYFGLSEYTEIQLNFFFLQKKLIL